MKSRWSHISILLFVAAAVASCDTGRIYEKNIAINKYVWESADRPSFQVEIVDTSVLYNLYVNVRHAEIYPYRNIWLLISTRFPDSTQASRRIEIMLADEEGNWFGDGLGDIWDLRTMIQEHAFFAQPGTYVFSLEQNMRQDPLPGIMAVGLRIEKTGIRRNNTAP